MSSSLFYGYPQLAVIPQAGLLGLGAYSFGTVSKEKKRIKRERMDEKEVGETLFPSVSLA